MELAEGRTGRSRRANAGSLLSDLLAKGLDAEEEELLRAYSDATSDSSFSEGSDEEAIDEVDSDFSAEEVLGTLEGEAVETEKDIRRMERAERQRERARHVSRSGAFAKRAAAAVAKAKATAAAPRARPAKRRAGRDGSDLDDDEEDEEEEEEGGGGALDLRKAVRARRAPTIPLDVRLAAAHARAAAQREGHDADEAAEGGDGALPFSPLREDATGSFNVGIRRRRRGRGGTAAAASAAATAGGGVATRRGRWGGVATGGLSAASVAGTGAAGGLALAAATDARDWRCRLYAGDEPQRVRVQCGRGAQAAAGVNTIVSFSAGLPPIFAQRPPSPT